MVLGQEHKGVHQALACNALISDVKSGASTGVARTLIDSGATQSFVSQRWAKENLEDMHAVSTRLVEAVDGRKIPSYGSRDVQLRLADRNGTRKVMTMICEAVDMTVYDAILGMDWLRSVNRTYDWAAGNWGCPASLVGKFQHTDNIIESICNLV
ncbi:uncharacterized protein N7515_006996 [Penicillium bovifimosum]|uniref:Uncharacterized protein n=1 Tax=Penicillium bovifimosum TaxID=126998 RepID=A0A9W9GVT1_9EURO|nr:uncharacterized protein N7515_006996 [Penicillium bovifimosum]KAJ5130957.1 hypothetical protein N7515_006996 [Penicillium bovifimosum]